MIKLNDNNIIVGQIKQLLHTFNLPQCQVGSAYPNPGSHFITKHHIMRWDDASNIVPCDRYVYGQEYVNLTTNLPINNTIYDIETHRYLGRYLRFLRDYNGVNLMSMYNCWDGALNTKRFDVKLGESADAKTVSFKSEDDDCVVYKVPVSISDFTISIHGSTTVEMCVYIESAARSDAQTISTIAKSTYKKRRINGRFEYSPFSKISSAANSMFIAQHVKNLNILIKIPKNIETSLVVLEGNYLNNFNAVQEYFIYKPTVRLGVDGANISLLANIERSIIDAQHDIAYTAISDEIVEIQTADNAVLLAISDKDFKIDSPIESGHHVVAQLLSMENTSSNYLLADRLVEYLTQNAISPLSESYEITRIQKALNMLRGANSIGYRKDMSSENCKKLYKNAVRKMNSVRAAGFNSDRHLGIWHPADLQDLRSILYKSPAAMSYDALGYLDKDLEAVLKGVIDNV